MSQGTRFTPDIVWSAPFRWSIVATISYAHEVLMSPKPVNVKQVLVYLTHEQHARLLKWKERTGAPVSEIIRRAIDRYLKAEDSKR